MTINATAIIPTGELRAHATQTIREYIGEAAFYCDIFQFIACIFNEVICDGYGVDSQKGPAYFEYDVRYGEPEWMKNGLTADEMLTGYSMPIDPAYRLCYTVKNALESVVQYSLGGIYEHKFYTFYLTLSGDIVLQEHNHEPIERKQPTSEEQLVESIQQGIENGDWYPEQLRRLAGRL